MRSISSTGFVFFLCRDSMSATMSPAATRRMLPMRMRMPLLLVFFCGVSSGASVISSVLVSCVCSAGSGPQVQVFVHMPWSRAPLSSYVQMRPSGSHCSFASRMRLPHSEGCCSSVGFSSILGSRVSLVVEVGCSSFFPAGPRRTASPALH